MAKKGSFTRKATPLCCIQWLELSWRQTSVLAAGVCPIGSQPLATIRQKEEKGGTLGGLVAGHELTGGDGVVSCQHASGEVLGDWFSGEVEVAEHFVGTPAAQKLDHVGVNFGDEQCHGTPCSERAG